MHLYADEAGDFVFKRNGKASKYYILCTIGIEDCSISHQLHNLRRQLAWDQKPVSDYFHCTTDKQEVRDEVFRIICEHDFTVHATVMEKSKAQPQVRVSEERFYQYAWLYHLRYSGRIYRGSYDEFHLTAATIGVKKKRTAFEDAVRDVCNQTVNTSQWRTSFWPSQSDPCLQMADYCTWAIQRKWEMGCTRSYDLIKSRIVYEYDLWRRGSTHWY
ncbi:DUF3800 domain-containing protein [Rhizorhabdus histidinilytica]